MVRDINERRAELKVERASLEAQLEEAEETARQAPNSELLHELPLGSVRLDGLPDELSRQLFEALRLEIRYDHATQKATCRVTLVGESVAAVSQVLNRSNVVPLVAETAGSSATSKEGQPMAASSTSSSMMVCVASRRGRQRDVAGRGWLLALPILRDPGLAESSYRKAIDAGGSTALNDYGVSCSVGSAERLALRYLNRKHLSGYVAIANAYSEADSNTSASRGHLRGDPAETVPAAR